MNARAKCPWCSSASVESLQGLIQSAIYDYFRCAECKQVWQVPKGQDEPAASLEVPPADASSRALI